MGRLSNANHLTRCGIVTPNGTSVFNFCGIRQKSDFTRVGYHVWFHQLIQSLGNWFFCAQQRNTVKPRYNTFFITHNNMWCDNDKCKIYRQISNIRRTLRGNTLVDHSDVVGASPVGAAPTTSSWSTWHLASIDWAKTTATWDENHFSFGIRCALY